MDWKSAGTFDDILYHQAEGIAKITINRPEVRNAFRPQTVRELIDAFHRAHMDPAIGVIILTGAGDLAFCSGGDQRVRGDEAATRTRQGVAHLNVLDLQRQIRTLPKPVVAMVAGYAIGGGHVLHLICDLTIAADNARFGQTGPRVGSFDGGFGAGLMARTVGLKKAKEIWFLCRQYDAQEALEMGLVNTVVPLAELENDTVDWCREMLQLSPDRAAHAQVLLQCRHRRPGRHPGAGRQRHRALLYDAGRTGRARCLAGEAATRFRQIPAQAMMLFYHRDTETQRKPRSGLLFSPCLCASVVQ